MAIQDESITPINEDTVAPTDVLADDLESPKPSPPRNKSPSHSSGSERRVNEEMVEMRYKQLGLKMEKDTEAGEELFQRAKETIERQIHSEYAVYCTG